MRNLYIICSLIFAALVCFYFVVLKPEKYVEGDLYDDIIQRGVIKVGINTNTAPFAFIDKDGNYAGYDVDLAQYVAQYMLGSRDKVEFIPVTPSNRILKATTGEVDIVIATMTITPQRREIIEFSVPYDVAGQAMLVQSTSKITNISELSGLNVGVVWGTTAEKNMLNLVPNANVMGFKTYDEAYSALKSGQICALTSDDTILSKYASADDTVKLLPKRYSREPYGIGFRKGKGSKKLKQSLNSAILDMKQKGVINRLHKKWLG